VLVTVDELRAGAKNAKNVTVRRIKDTLESLKVLPRGHGRLHRGPLLDILLHALGLGPGGGVAGMSSDGEPGRSMAARSYDGDKDPVAGEPETPATHHLLGKRRRMRTLTASVMTTVVIPEGKPTWCGAGRLVVGAAAPAAEQINQEKAEKCGLSGDLVWKSVSEVDDELRHELSHRPLRPMGTGVHSKCDLRATGVQEGKWSMRGSLEHNNHVSHNTALHSLQPSAKTVGKPPTAPKLPKGNVENGARAGAGKAPACDQLSLVQLLQRLRKSLLSEHLRLNRLDFHDRRPELPHTCITALVRCGDMCKWLSTLPYNDARARADVERVLEALGMKTATGVRGRHAGAAELAGCGTLWSQPSDVASFWHVDSPRFLTSHEQHQYLAASM